MQALQPIGIVKPERKQAIHTLVEQLLLPDQERLALEIEKEQQAKQMRAKLLEEQRIFIEEQEEQKRRQNLLNDGLMEAQHLEVA